MSKPLPNSTNSLGHPRWTLYKVIDGDMPCLQWLDFTDRGEGQIEIVQHVAYDSGRQPVATPFAGGRSPELARLCWKKFLAMGFKVLGPGEKLPSRRERKA